MSLTWWRKLKDQTLRAQFEEDIPRLINDIPELTHQGDIIRYLPVDVVPGFLSHLPREELAVSSGHVYSYVWRRHLGSVSAVESPHLRIQVGYHPRGAFTYLPVFSQDTVPTISYSTWRRIPVESADDMKLCAADLLGVLVSTLSPAVARSIDVVEVRGVPTTQVNLRTFPNLTYVVLDDCGITEVPASASTLRSLESLELSNNSITHLPRRLLRCWPKIRTIDLTSNRIEFMCIDGNYATNVHSSDSPTIYLAENPVYRVDGSVPDMYNTVRAAANALAVTLLVVGTRRYCRGHKFPRDIVKILHSGVLDTGYRKEWAGLLPTRAEINENPLGVELATGMPA